MDADRYTGMRLPQGVRRRDVIEMAVRQQDGIGETVPVREGLTDGPPYDRGGGTGINHGGVPVTGCQKPAV